VTEIESRLPLGDGSRDKIGLSKTRKKREYETASDPAEIIPDETQHAAIF
jgi:hypothetical protein